MGVTIHYRGKISDMALIDQFEEELLEQVKRLGGTSLTWQTLTHDDPTQGLRGAMIDLHPSCEPICLFVSRGGCLLNFTELDAAEYDDFEEPMWIGTKTQFAPSDVHRRVVDLLTWLSVTYFPELEVQDEGEYWETRDAQTLEVNRAIVEQAMSALDRTLGQLELSADEVEDDEVVAAKIEEAVAKLGGTMKASLH